MGLTSIPSIMIDELESPHLSDGGRHILLTSCLHGLALQGNEKNYQNVLPRTHTWLSWKSVPRISFLFPVPLCVRSNANRPAEAKLHFWVNSQLGVRISKWSCEKQFRSSLGQCQRPLPRESRSPLWKKISSSKLWNHPRKGEGNGSRSLTCTFFFLKTWVGRAMRKWNDIFYWDGISVSSPFYSAHCHLGKLFVIAFNNFWLILFQLVAIDQYTRIIRR